MLVALLSSLETAGDGATCPRAFLHVAGRCVIERQAELVLALGCERVICMASGITPEILAAQRVVERAGRQFHAIRSLDALRVQVVGADELIGIADGVLPERELVMDFAGQRRCVATFPADPAVAHGFERISRDMAWAGIVRCAGSDLERLADLPSDIDPLSALMRAALQSGASVQQLPADFMAEGRWPLIDTADKARQTGRKAVERRYIPAPWAGPGNAAIDRMVRRNADRLLGASHGATALFGSAAITGLVSLVLSGAGMLASGLAMVGFSAALARAWAGISVLKDAPRSADAQAILLATDGALVLGMVVHSGLAGWDAVIFPLIVLIGLLRLSAWLSPVQVSAMVSDRVVLSLILAIAASQGALGAALQVLALLALALCLFAARSVQLTRA